MSTRATIKFTEGDEVGDETFFVYRHSDGLPSNVLQDIALAIETSKGRWSGPECGLMVSLFLGIHFKPNERLPDYMLTSGFHGDESYRYLVRWVADESEPGRWTSAGRWVASIMD